MKETTFEELIANRGYIIYTNVGYSMMPLLRPRRDIIEIRPKGSERCRKYDTVLYKRNEKYILHRILKVHPSSYSIAGDNSIYVEHGVKDSQIIGIMTRVIRGRKEIYMNDRLYLIYVHLWCDFYPLRMFLLRVIKLANRVLQVFYRQLSSQCLF